MAQPVTVYRWDDPGAPQIVERRPSEIINILIKCLVEGYGTKPSLGWTMPFYDALSNAAAFRNSITDGGSGGYLKIWDALASNAVGGNLRLQSSQSMTDINTQFRPGRISTIATNQNTMTTWALIGTSTAVYFFTSRSSGLGSGMVASNNYNVSLFFGDIFSAVPNDASRFQLCANPAATSDVLTAAWFDALEYLTSANFPGTGAPMRMYDADGDSSFVHYKPAPLHTMNIQVSQDASLGQPPSAPSGLVLFPILVITESGYPTSLKDRNNIILQNSPTRPALRGCLPGLFQSMYGGWGNNNWPTIINNNGLDYWLLRNVGNGVCSLMIKLGEWDDPFN